MDNTILDEIFDSLDKNPDAELDYSFTSATDLNNYEALNTFIEDNLGECSEQEGSWARLDHPKYNFYADITSEGLGDFFNHGIIITRGEKE